MKLEKVVKWMGLGCILAGAARMGMTPSSLIWGSDSTPELTFAFIASILMGFTLIILSHWVTWLFGSALK